MKTMLKNEKEGSPLIFGISYNVNEGKQDYVLPSKFKASAH